MDENARYLGARWRARASWPAPPGPACKHTRVYGPITPFVKIGRNVGRSAPSAQKMQTTIGQGHYLDRIALEFHRRCRLRSHDKVGMSKLRAAPLDSLRLWEEHTGKLTRSLFVRIANTSSRPGEHDFSLALALRWLAEACHGPSNGHTRIGRAN